MENLRVRRAGFAYRRRFETFLQRWRPLSQHFHCLEKSVWLCLMFLVHSILGTSHSVQKPGQTGAAASRMVSRLWSTTWATSQRNTKWEGDGCWSGEVWVRRFFFKIRLIESSSCRSKIFICFPKTLFNTEDALEAKKTDLGKGFGEMDIYIFLNLFCLCWKGLKEERTLVHCFLTCLCSSFNPADFLEGLQGEIQIPPHPKCRSLQILLQ